MVRGGRSTRGMLKRVEAFGWVGRGAGFVGRVPWVGRRLVRGAAECISPARPRRNEPHRAGTGPRLQRPWWSRRRSQRTPAEPCATSVSRPSRPVVERRAVHRCRHADTREREPCTTSSGHICSPRFSNPLAVDSTVSSLKRLRTRDRSPCKTVWPRRIWCRKGRSTR